MGIGDQAPGIPAEPVDTRYRLPLAGEAGVTGALSRNPRSRLTPLVFVACSLALHVLVFLGLSDSPQSKPRPEPASPERRLEISFIVESRPEPATPAQESLPQEEISSREMASIEQKPRQEGDQPAVVRESPAPSMPESGVAVSQNVTSVPSKPARQKDQVGQQASTSARTRPVTAADSVAKSASEHPQSHSVPADTALATADAGTEPAAAEQSREQMLSQQVAVQEPAPAPDEFASPFRMGQGKLRQLDDSELAEVRGFIDGDDPDAARWRTISQQLVKLEQQIYSAWNGQGKWPLDLGGVIRFQLTEKGTLQKVYVQLGSGRADFDQSILDAIHRVIDRGTAETRQLAGMNYLYFRFQYHAGGRPRQSGELLPWEREKIVAGELGENTGS